MKQFFLAFFFTRHPWLIVLITGSALLVAMGELVSVGVAVALIASLAQNGSDQAISMSGPVGWWYQLWRQVASEYRIVILAALLAGTAIFNFLANLCHSFTVSATQAKANIDVKNILLEKIFHMDLLAFQRYKLSDLNTYLGPHSNNVGEMVFNVINPLPKFFGLVLMLGLSFTLNPKMTLLSLALFSCIGLTMRWLFGLQKTAGIQQKDAVKDFQFLSLDTLHSYKAIRMFSREGFFRDRVRTAFTRLNKIVRRKYILIGVVPGLNQAMATTAAAVVLLLFGLFYPHDKAMIVLYLTFFYILSCMATHANVLLNIRSMISVTLPSTRELFEFLDQHEDRTISEGPQRARSLQSQIQFSHVGFAYSDEDPFSVRDLNLTIGRGQRIGIVGTSGAGKSTLIDLLLKVIEPQSGQILLDGINQTEFSTAGWRQVFGIVPQESLLLNGTIKENIQFGNTDLTDNDLREAANLAMILEFIESLPNGFQTVVGDRGTRLSGGQRQRLAIARALANQRSILIFDEATSSLDSIAEKAVQESIDNLPQEITILIVAHRLSTLRHCDQIIAMDHGRIIEQGTIAQLVAADGLFNSLSRQQGVQWPAEPTIRITAGQPSATTL